MTPKDTTWVTNYLKPKIKIMGDNYSIWPDDFMHGQHQLGDTSGDKNKFDAHPLGDNF